MRSTRSRTWALSAQAKVLRVLQTGELTRVGGEKEPAPDGRVPAATNCDREQMVKDGTLREDLNFLAPQA